MLVIIVKLFNSGITITKNNDEIEVAEHNLSIMGRKQSSEVKFSLSKSDKKRKQVYISPWMSIFFYIRIQNNRQFHFARAYVCIREAICNNETLASDKI